MEAMLMIKIYGALTDQAGRCRHYHSQLDIVALKCAACQKYYACYRCHDEVADHHFVASSKSEPYPVLCGNCFRLLSKKQYLLGYCPYCQTAFNPNCRFHHQIYFKA